MADTSPQSLNPALQRFILPDPVASLYLQNDSCVTLLEHRREIKTYQAYVVEQWTVSRTHPTFTIVTHTGDASDKIVATVLGIPKDETLWSHRLRTYFRALNHFHARRRDTPDGVLMITSLPGFPSTLTVIPVPDGDVGKHCADFFVNEDLKRLGCSGRVGLTIMYPNNATVAKYHQLYRTSDKNPLYSSVIELVRMCQIALHMFALLDSDYIDGLLCDITEHAIRKWWVTFGNDVYSTEPHDGILGPTTVAALLGLLLGARNRLNSLSIPVPKDPFDMHAMKRGIWHFQKSQRLHRNRRLDDLTIRKLHSLTEKATHNEGVWRVPKAVKTTVAELSGKGEELAAEGNTRKRKAGIADIETTDIDVFEQLASGERCKWLWHAKPLKHTNAAILGEAHLEEIMASKGHVAEEARFGRRPRVSDGTTRKSFEDTTSMAPNGSPRRSLEDIHPSKNPSHRGAAARKVHGVFDDGKAGIDRLLEAVHPPKRGPDASSIQRTPTDLPRDGLVRARRPSTVRSHTSPVSPNTTTSPIRAPTSALRNEISSADIDEKSQLPERKSATQDSQTRMATLDLQTILKSPQRRKSAVPDVARENGKSSGDRVPNLAKYHGVNLDESLPVPQNFEQDIPPMLRRTNSLNVLRVNDALQMFKDQRRLSFSLAESSILMSDGINSPTDMMDDEGEDNELIRQRCYSENLRRIRLAIKDLSQEEASWTTRQMSKLDDEVQQSMKDHEMLREYHESPSQAAQRLQEVAALAIQDQRDIVEEGKHELETLTAKLDYELANLRGKIEDVELGVDEFESAVASTETRVDEVEKELFGRGGWACIVC